MTGARVGAALLLALLAAPVGGQAPVTGTVLDGLTGQPVAGAEVAFLMPGEDGQLTEIARKPVSADGSFAFSGPFLRAGLPFVLVGFYRDVPYPTGSLEVGQQSAVLIEVYEPTDRPDALAITGEHHFVAVDVDGLEVARLVTVQNRGEQTYVGRGTGPDWHVTEFVLPAGLTELQSHTGAMHRVAAGHYFDTQPLPPGDTQIAFSYLVPAEAFDGDYVHQVIYPTEALDLYVQPPTLQPAGPFEDLGPVNLHDRQYRHLRLRDLVPGQSVRLPLPVPRSLRWMVKWAVLGAGLLGALAAAFLATRRAASPAPRPAVGPAALPRDLETRRQAVLEELARLDDSAANRRRREQLMAEAVSLYRALERGP
ncbi:MAG: hypothetical protein ABIL09_30310 [Gemmatimonadota bacterium]